MGFVEAHTIGVQEGLVVQVFLEHDVNHARNESRVRPRTQRHPLVR